MKSIVILKNECFIYKGKNYNEDKMRKSISKNVEFIILEENIIIKRFKNIKYLDDEYIEKIVNSEYEIDSDILMHYEYNKRLKELYLYSIRNGNKIKRVAKNANIMTVTPIQFYIKKLLKKLRFKLKNCIILAEIDNKIYYFEIYDNYIIRSKVGNYNREYIEDIFKNYYGEKNIVIDKNIREIMPKNIINEFKNSIINIGDIINEKILKI